MKENLITLNNIERNIDIIKTIILFILTYYTNFKIINKKVEINLISAMKIVLLILVAIMSAILQHNTNYFFGTIILIISISIIFSKEEIGNSILTTIISLSINYIINLFSIFLYYIPEAIFQIENDYTSVFILTVIRLILLVCILNIKKLKYGFSFLKGNLKNMYLDLLIFNISAIMLFSIIALKSSTLLKNDEIGLIIVILSFISIESIKKSFQVYYKQKLLIQDLNETKQELESKRQEIEELEQENLTISKRNHSLDHKQKALEYKLNELSLKYEVAEEIDIKDKLNNISKELYKKQVKTELSQTGINEIDDMLKFMQSECTKNNIDLDLQINGNIYHMINNIISKEELSILIADHVKDAIIAIKHTDNINKSILIRLGKIDDCYGLYIYDSGIEFEKETLENLGKKPSTTHADEGGTGIGFMNTFETLRKYKASLIIKELGKPSKENYTKIIMIKFDNRNEFKIDSYRN